MGIVCLRVWCLQSVSPSYLLDEESEGSEDVAQSGGGLVDLEEEEVGIQNLLHHVLALVHQ